MKTEALRIEISNTINKSGLPIETIYYLMKDIFHEVENIYTAVVQKEMEEAKNKEEEKSEDESGE